MAPKLIAAFGIDELRVHPKPVAATPYGPLEHVANVQLPPDPPEVDRFVLVGECGVSTDDERTGDTRQVAGQALGHTINEIFLLGITTEVGKRQHNDGKTRR